LQLLLQNRRGRAAVKQSQDQPKTNVIVDPPEAAASRGRKKLKEDVFSFNPSKMTEVADKQPVRGKKKTTSFQDHKDHFVYDVRV